MTPTNTDLIQDFIDLNPRCTRRMLMDATGLIKCTLGKNIRRIKNQLIVEIEYVNGKPVEHYTLNPHYDAQSVVIKQYEPINVKHHPLFALYGMAA